MAHLFPLPSSKPSPLLSFLSSPWFNTWHCFCSSQKKHISCPPLFFDIDSSSSPQVSPLFSTFTSIENYSSLHLTTSSAFSFYPTASKSLSSYHVLVLLSPLLFCPPQRMTYTINLFILSKVLLVFSWFPYRYPLITNENHLSWDSSCLVNSHILHTQWMGVFIYQFMSSNHKPPEVFFSSKYYLFITFSWLIVFSVFHHFFLNVYII